MIACSSLRHDASDSKHINSKKKQNNIFEAAASADVLLFFTVRISVLSGVFSGSCAQHEKELQNKKSALRRGHRSSSSNGGKAVWRASESTRPNRQARRDQRWTGRPSNWTLREQDQNPSRQGPKGSAKNGTQWKSREGNQFGKGNKKGNKTWESNEQVPGSIEWPDAKRPKRVWGPALSQERGKP